MYLDEGQRLGEIGATQFASNVQGRAQTVYVEPLRSMTKQRDYSDLFLKRKKNNRKGKSKEFQCHNP